MTLPTTSGGWPTMSGGGMVWTAIAHPTGNASTSRLGIEKGVPREVRMGPVPDVGEHTRAILSELGYSDPQIEVLERANVV